MSTIKDIEDEVELTLIGSGLSKRLIMGWVDQAALVGYAEGRKDGKEGQKDSVCDHCQDGGCYD